MPAGAPVWSHWGTASSGSLAASLQDSNSLASTSVVQFSSALPVEPSRCPVCLTIMSLTACTASGGAGDVHSLPIMLHIVVTHDKAGVPALLCLIMSLVTAVMRSRPSLRPNVVEAVSFFKDWAVFLSPPIAICSSRFFSSTASPRSGWLKCTSSLPCLLSQLPPLLMLSNDCGAGLLLILCRFVHASFNFSARYLLRRGVY